MHPSLDSHDRYESIMYDMSKWIQERTWGGHERGCPQFGTDKREGCECIFAVIDDYHTAIRDHARALMRAGLLDDVVPVGLPDFTPKMIELQAQVHWLEHELSVWRARSREPHP